MKKCTKSIITLLIFTIVIIFNNLLIASIVQPQDSVPIPDTTRLTKQIDEITIAAFRTTYRWMDIPAPVNYITAAELKTGSSITPIEAINRVPGIIMHHGTYNTNRLTIRGIGSRSIYATNKIKAYFGDIPLTTGDGETTLEDLEPLSIRHIEIIKGPSSSLYGAGLGGTILFYPATVKNNFALYESTVASFGTFKNTALAGAKLKNANFYTLFSSLSSDGYRNNNSTDRNNFFLHSQIDLSERIAVNVLLKYTKMKAFIPSSLDKETYDNSPELAAANWQNVKGYEDYTTGQMGVSFDIKSKKNSEYKLSAFGHFRDADELRPFNMLKESSQTGGIRGNYIKKLLFNNWAFNIVTGFEIFREHYDWTYAEVENFNQLISDNSEKRNYENLFFQAEGNRNRRFVFSGGINYNSTRYKYTDYFLTNGDQSGLYRYDPVFSQRFGMNYRILPAFAVYMNISHGFSPPTLAETLFPEGEINPEIKPEQGWNFEGGVKGGISDRVIFEMSYYRIYVSDLLVARRTGEDAYVGVNAGQSVHPGVEAAVSIWLTQPGNFPSFTLNGNTTLANYHFTDFIDDGISYSGKLLPGTSKALCFTGASFQPVKNLTFNAAYRFSGKMPVDDANSIYSDAYSLTNVEMLFQTKYHSLIFNFKAGVNNLFDEKYASMLAINVPSFNGIPPRYYYPGNPRNFFVTATIGFEK